MPSFDRPPEEQLNVKPFDPLVLDSTVIAIPLLNEMKPDLQRIDAIRSKHPDAIKQWNSAIEFQQGYPGGAEAARQRVLELLPLAADAAINAAARRLNNVPDAFKHEEQDRLETLKTAKEEQAVDPIFSDAGSSYSFARLHASVIRRLMSKNSTEAGVNPIARVHPTRFEVIIDLNLEHPGGSQSARKWVRDHIEKAKEDAQVRDGGQYLHLEISFTNSQYMFARLEARVIQKLVELDLEQAKATAEHQRAADAGSARQQLASNKCRAIYHIWPDFEVSACLNKSIATVKADAAQRSFSALGLGITWALMDSGVAHDHVHFVKHDDKCNVTFRNVDPSSQWHRDFTTDGAGPFDDQNGHGTHVAGIIAGECNASNMPVQERPIAISRCLKKDAEDVEYVETRLERISGIAPLCKVVSLKVLDENGKGSVSNLIAAINHIQEINGYGRRLLIQGVNMSLGYNFEPEWFACGQSPLCVEVDRLVKSGVVVVVAAGNTGYGTLKSSIGSSSAGLALTINDPGNSDLAITVGSTHREMPHVYGVSYFSSKGPTGDGRLKPDLVAPGEKIISCATGKLKEKGAPNKECQYVETSGTSMAAPHVSGVIAAFLSVRTEFIGRPERVKEIFVSTATDLRRDRYFQGAGLVDLMRAIQSV